MGVNQLTGTLWHKERVHRAEGDARRYKGRCAFYDYDNDSCKMYCGRCRGSAHCDHYKAITDEEFKARQKIAQRGKKLEKADDSYWY